MHRVPSPNPTSQYAAQHAYMQAALQHLGGSISGNHRHDQLQLVNATPDNMLLNEFKNDVRTWMELDNSIRRLQAAIKDRRAAKKLLSDRILQFMSRYNIEDLNTKDGNLRYKVTYVRTPLSQHAIKDRISTYFSANAQVAQEVQGAVFGNRERTERPCLRRLKP